MYLTNTVIMYAYICMYIEVLGNTELSSLHYGYCKYRIAQNCVGENFGEFGKLNFIRQYFTQPNLSPFFVKLLTSG